MTTCPLLRILKIKKKKSISHILFSLSVSHTQYHLFQTSLSFSNLFNFFFVFFKSFRSLLSLSQTSSELLLSLSQTSLAFSSVSGSLTHNTMANTKSSALSLSFSFTQNTIFLILHTSSPFFTRLHLCVSNSNIQICELFFSFLRFFIGYDQECFS